MIEEKDIVGSSLAITAGAAVAAVTGCFRPGLALMLVSLDICLLIHLRTTFDRTLTLLLFTFLGYFCFSSQQRCDTVFISPLSINWLSESIDSIAFEHKDTGALLKALLTGDKSSLSRETAECFRSSGASHILALSGLHLGIIYGAVAKLMSISGRSRLAFHIRAAACIILCGLYTLSTGASPSTVRAFLFVSIGEIGRLCTWRSRSAVRTWCLALMIQVALYPSAICTAGFQLSYLAMLGIFLIFPILKEWYPVGLAIDPLRRIWEAAALSCSCQAFTAPLVWLRFGTFPKYFILTNLIALPLTECLILGGLGAVALSAAGVCPDIVIQAVDLLAGLLTNALSTISLM